MEAEGEKFKGVSIVYLLSPVLTSDASINISISKQYVLLMLMLMFMSL